MLTPRQKAALLLAVGLALTSVAVAAALALAEEPPTEEPPVAAAEDDHAMDVEERCRHMPEHCGGGRA